MTGWIGYCLLTSALVAIAAYAGERGLAHYRRPVRWVWAGAIAGSLLIPLVAFFFPPVIIPASTSAASGVAFGTPTAVTGDMLSVAATDGDSLARLDSAGDLLLAIWITSVAGFGLFLAASYRRLRREMRSWTPGQVLDAPVLLSPDRGPAVVGLRRGVIVLPRWVIRLEEDLLRLVFLHEREHQLAGDHKLFALALAAVALMPWNPVLWWALRRLRLGMELDCDRRVLARDVPPRDYAEALLAVGTRISKTHLVATAFAEPRSAIETRLRRMTQPVAKLRGPRALVAAGIAALAVGVACQSEPPVSPLAETAAEVALVSDADPLAPERVPGAQIVDLDGDGDLDVMIPSVEDPSATPSFIPYDTPPRLRNAGEVREALEGAYPWDLEAERVSGRVEVWIYLDQTGAVANRQVKTSSGIPELDAAALEVAARMRFEPARYQGARTGVWVSQWLSFEGLPRGQGGDRGAPPNEPPENAPGVHVVVTGEGLRTVEGPNLQIQGDRIEIEGLGQEFDPPSGSPLIVIDGVVQNPSVPLRLSDIDGLEIDHLEIIRGRAAVDLYGSRGLNGVIRITTKAAATPDPLPHMDSEGDPEIVQIEMNPAERVTGISDATGRVRIRASDAETRPRPLLVIDGVIAPPDFELSDLHADDIAHVEIVKGAAGLSRYGERARNGVIHITTKQGAPVRP